MVIIPFVNRLLSGFPAILFECRDKALYITEMVDCFLFRHNLNHLRSVFVQLLLPKYTT